MTRPPQKSVSDSCSRSRFSKADDISFGPGYVLQPVIEASY